MSQYKVEFHITVGLELLADESIIPAWTDEFFRPEDITEVMKAGAQSALADWIELQKMGSPPLDHWFLDGNVSIRPGTLKGEFQSIDEIELIE